MADFVSFSIESGSTSQYGLGELDGLTGTAGAVALLGGTLLLGGISLGLTGGSHGCLFEAPASGATYSSVSVVPSSSSYGPPIVSGSSGTFGAVTVYGETYLAGGLDTGLSLGSLNSCLFPVSVTPTPTSNTFTGSGGRTIWRCPNVWDGCLLGERQIRGAYDWDKLLRTSPATGCYHPCPPWINPPANSSVFRPQSVSAIPALESVDTRILSVTIPWGMDGVLQGLLFQISGSGYTFASSDIAWRLRIGRRWVRTFSAIDTPLGSVTSGPLWLEDGIRLKTLQTVSVWVNFGPGSLSRIAPDSRLITMLDGYLYSQAAWRTIT